MKQIALGIVLLAGLLVGTAWADEALNKALFDFKPYGDLAKVKELISRGADVNAKGNNGNTPLHFAVIYYGNKDVAEFLISKGADVNAKDNDGVTPLDWAFSGDRKEVAELLISKGADVNAKNNIGETLLHKVAYKGITEVAVLLISKGADVNAINYSGQTPLHLAAWMGQKEVAELLISKGAVVNAKANNGWTPLFWAAYKGQKEVAELLISKGADVNAKDISGHTPMDLASEEKNEVTVILQAALQEEIQKKMAMLLQTALQNQSGNQREAFNRVMANYKGRAMSDAIRRPFIALAAKLKPSPAVPEEARKYLVRGNALLQDAKNPGEARAAIQEYQNALLAAPWWNDAYFNLSKAQELAGDLDSAYSSMQYYLLTEPQDKREAQDRLYAIEAKRDKAKGK